MFLLKRFFQRKKKSDKTVVADKERSTNSQKCPTKSDTKLPMAKKPSKPSGCWPFSLFRRNNRVSPMEIIDLTTSEPNSSKEISREELKQKLSTLFSCPEKRTIEEEIKQDESALSAEEEEEKEPTGKLCSRSSEEDNDKEVMVVSSLGSPPSYVDMSSLDTNCITNPTESLPDPEELFSVSADTLDLRTPSFKESWGNSDSLGFPNLGNTCYMNSSLQSLLTLKDFIKSISRTEKIWRSEPEAQVLKNLIAIRDCHNSTNLNIKIELLQSLKDIISGQNLQFEENTQNDAHEFLTSVLSQIQSPSLLLQWAAARLGRTYTCPVEENFGFKMEYTRTCKRCRVQSLRQEQFTNLSVDLLPGGSIEEMIEKYLLEVELDYSCECGGKSSGQTLTFATLPKTFIIHLKRFRFTPTFRLQKIYDPVRIQRDIVVSSKMGGGCFSLVSTISHSGNTREGHYICDSIDPEDCPLEPTDHWLTFSDSTVLKTSGRGICRDRQECAYVLFYRRHI